MVSEMISCEALVRNNQKTHQRAVGSVYFDVNSASTLQGHLAYNETRGEAISASAARTVTLVQIMGADPKTMAESAKINESLGCDVIDINMGCPARKIVSNESGSALMKNEDLAVRIAEAVVNAVKIPVTLKMRLGWDAEHINCFSLAKKFEDVGIKMLAIHCRTRNQMYSGTANWSAIAQLKEIIKIPYLCNGDIKTPESAMEAMKLSGASGVMIGRAALGRPWLLRQIMDFIHQKKITPAPSLEEQLRIVMRHFFDTLDFYGELHGIRMFRKHFCWYSSGLCGASRFRETINRSDDISFIEDYVKEFYESNFGGNRLGGGVTHVD
ncbi:putative tRNA-dihydrouridine synthase [Alphaproteobacteria bacterium]|nr:putative tRNA-dihydrouridine synthase [Alphaproteobacteria bacterium]